MANPCIYMITSPSNKIYVGQTTNFKKRYNSHKNSNNTQQKLYYSFNKYGFENHKIEIIHYCNKNELNNWEKFYIKLFDTFSSKHGLNLTSGGNAGRKVSFIPKSQSFKEKMSAIKTGRKRPKFSDEWLENLREAGKRASKRESSSH